MTGRRRGPAPYRTGPHEAPARKPRRQRSADDDRQPTAGELLRRLASPILEAAEPTDAAVRLGEAAEAAGVLVARQRLDRVAAVAPTTTAQAARIALVSAEDVVRAALSGGAQ